MYLKLFINDFRKNPWNNGILLLFITLAAAIAVAVTFILTELFISISSMYDDNMKLLRYNIFMARILVREIL